MPRGVDRKTGEVRGKPQKPSNPNTAKKRYGKYAQPRKKGEQLPPEERTEPRWDESTQRWLNGKGNPICGQPRTGRSTAGPGICCQDAGWGTDHVGSGPCKNHGGSLPEVSNKHVVNQVLEGKSPLDPKGLWGAPINVTPEQAILEEVHRTQGAVTWLGEQLQNLPQSDHHKPFGHYLVDKFQEERTHLVAVCKAAIGLGIAQKQVELAQEQGKLLAAVLQAFIADPDLNLTPAQRAKVPDLLRKHLMTIPQAVLQPQPALNPADPLAHDPKNGE